MSNGSDFLLPTVVLKAVKSSKSEGLIFGPLFITGPEDTTVGALLKLGAIAGFNPPSGIKEGSLSMDLPLINTSLKIKRVL